MGLFSGLTKWTRDLVVVLSLGTAGHYAGEAIDPPGVDFKDTPPVVNPAPAAARQTPEPGTPTVDPKPTSAPLDDTRPTTTSNASRSVADRRAQMNRSGSTTTQPAFIDPLNQPLAPTPSTETAFSLSKMVADVSFKEKV